MPEVTVWLNEPSSQLFTLKQKANSEVSLKKAAGRICLVPRRDNHLPLIRNCHILRNWLLPNISDFWMGICSGCTPIQTILLIFLAKISKKIPFYADQLINTSVHSVCGSCHFNLFHTWYTPLRKPICKSRQEFQKKIKLYIYIYILKCWIIKEN